MAVLRSRDGNNLVVDCDCGCNNGVRFRVDYDDDLDMFFLVSFLNGNWYRDQNDRVLRVVGRKLRKIIAIIRNKDHCYSEICMTRDDFAEFKEYINSVG